MGAGAEWTVTGRWLAGVMTTDLDRRLAGLAERQHGLITRLQVLELGGTRSAVQHRVGNGSWLALPGGVLRSAGAPVTDLQTALAVTLTHHGVLSHASAAALWGLPGFRLLPAIVTTARASGHHLGPQLALRHTTYLPDHHVVTVEAIPVLTPSRLIFQLAGSLRHQAQVELLCDRLWSRRLVSGRSLRAMRDELSEHGRDGMRIMRAILDDRPDAYVPPDSNLEARVATIVRDHDLPAMRRQVDLGGREWLGRVDFVGVDLPLVVFVDGEAWHSSVIDRIADARQQEQLEAEGFVVVRVTEWQVWHDVAAVVAIIRAGTLRARSARAAA